MGLRFASILEIFTASHQLKSKLWHKVIQLFAQAGFQVSEGAWKEPRTLDFFCTLHLGLHYQYCYDLKQGRGNCWPD